MKNSKINIMLAVVGVLTVGVFFRNVVASNFFDNNGEKVAINEKSAVSLDNLTLEKINFDFQDNINGNVEGYIEDDVQVVKFDLSTYSYPNITVSVDKPVKLIINANENNLNSCNYFIISQDFGIQKELTVGENIIEFTPTKAGQYIYSCWMGMIGANIVVVDEEIVPSAAFGDNIELGGCCSR